jgi:mannobiose 2-epimerase
MTRSAKSVAESQDRLRVLGGRMSRNLDENIMPFWLALEDRQFGGHHGLMDADGWIDPDAPKSAIFVSRLLWTLSRVGAANSDPVCLGQADQARSFLMRHMFDARHGGLFWSVTRQGSPLDMSKHLYAQAFGIYGLSAFYDVSGDAEALKAAQALFEIVELRRPRPGGPHGEAFDGAWRPTGNRLARDGLSETVTSNTHLHLIEAYTAFAIVWPHARAIGALRDLAEMLINHFLTADESHSHESLDARQQPLHGRISYGHDVELSWMIEAAGDVIGDQALSARLRVLSDRLVRSAAAEAQDPDGGWSTDNRLRGRGDRLWWVQAEAMIGLLNAAVRGDDWSMLDRAEATWAYIERTMVDHATGDWRSQVDRRGRSDPRWPKAFPWKDPYHQARACLVIASLSSTSANGARFAFL